MIPHQISHTGFSIHQCFLARLIIAVIIYQLVIFKVYHSRTTLLMTLYYKGRAFSPHLYQYGLINYFLSHSIMQHLPFNKNDNCAHPFLVLNLKGGI
jgi:hypothetical protein